MKDRIVVLLAALYFSAPASGESVDCSELMTTVAISKCKSGEFDAVQDKLTKYLEASVQHYDYDPVVVKAIRESQEQWEAYSTAHCDAIYAKWREGTIRGIMATECRKNLTKQRIHMVWESFLTYSDSSPPVLPEPER